MSYPARGPAQRGSTAKRVRPAADAGLDGMGASVSEAAA
jgi:hypothetical protein